MVMIMLFVEDTAIFNSSAECVEIFVYRKRRIVQSKGIRFHIY